MDPPAAIPAVSCCKTPESRGCLVRERIEDIPMLADYFVRKICTEYGIANKTIDKEALDLLATMEWSGNIRELRNVIERLIILCDDRITAEDVTTYAQAVL